MNKAEIECELKQTEKMLENLNSKIAYREKVGMYTEKLYEEMEYFEKKHYNLCYDLASLEQI